MSTQTGPGAKNVVAQDQPIAPGRRRRLRAAAAGTVAAGVALVSVALVTESEETPQAFSHPVERPVQRPVQRPVPPPGGPLFIPQLPGTFPTANRKWDDLRTLELYLNEDEEKAYREHGFRWTAYQSFRGRTNGGVEVFLTKAADPAGLLAALRDLEQGRSSPYPKLPLGRVKDTVAELGDGAVAYSKEFTFVTGPYVVSVSGYAYTPQAGKAKVTAAAQDQHELLKASLGDGSVDAVVGQDDR